MKQCWSLKCAQAPLVCVGRLKHSRPCLGTGTTGPHSGTKRLHKRLTASLALHNIQPMVVKRVTPLILSPLHITSGEGHRVPSINPICGHDVWWRICAAKANVVKLGWDAECHFVHDMRHSITTTVDKDTTVAHLSIQLPSMLGLEHHLEHL